IHWEACTSANQSYRSGVARLARHAIPEDEYPAGARSDLLSPSPATTSTVLWQRSLQRNGAPAEPLGLLIQSERGLSRLPLKIFNIINKICSSRRQPIIVRV